MIGKAGVLRTEEATEKCSDHAFLKFQKFKLRTELDGFCRFFYCLFLSFLLCGYEMMSDEEVRRKDLLILLFLWES